MPNHPYFASTVSREEFRCRGIRPLESYVEQGLKLAGKWTSPGGETKLFTASQDEFVLKWLKSKKLIIQKDNPDEYLLKSFESDHKLSNSDCDLDRNVSQIDLQIN